MCRLLLHCSDLDELLEQARSFHHVLTEAHLGQHPVLHLVKTTHKPFQVSCGGPVELLAAKYVVDQLHLYRTDLESRLRKHVKHAGSSFVAPAGLMAELLLSDNR